MIRTQTLFLTSAVLLLLLPEPARAQGPFRQIWPFQQRSNPEGERTAPSRVSRPRQQSSSPSRPSASATTGSGASGGQRNVAGSVITKPTVITRAGFYTLGENVAGEAGATTATIVITASEVTLDLAGRTLRGRASESADNCGIAILGNSVRVRNGVIADYSGENQCGVLVAAGVRDFVVEDLRVGNCETGILINPENDPANPVRSGRLERCSVTSGSIGILAFPSVGIALEACTVEGCIPRRQLEGEGSGAVLRGSGYLIRRSLFTSCRDGLRLEGDAGILKESLCTGNSGAGCVVGGENNLIVESSFSKNGEVGLDLRGTANRVDSCMVIGNGRVGIVNGGARGNLIWETSGSETAGGQPGTAAGAEGTTDPVAGTLQNSSTVQPE